MGQEETIIEAVKRTRLRWMGYLLKKEDEEPAKRENDLEVN